MSYVKQKMTARKRFPPQYATASSDSDSYFDSSRSNFELQVTESRLAHKSTGPRAQNPRASLQRRHAMRGERPLIFNDKRSHESENDDDEEEEKIVYKRPRQDDTVTLSDTSYNDKRSHESENDDDKEEEKIVYNRPSQNDTVTLSETSYSPLSPAAPHSSSPSSPRGFNPLFCTNPPSALDSFTSSSWTSGSTAPCSSVSASRCSTCNRSYGCVLPHSESTPVASPSRLADQSRATPISVSRVSLRLPTAYRVLDQHSSRFNNTQGVRNIDALQPVQQQQQPAPETRLQDIDQAALLESNTILRNDLATANAIILRLKQALDAIFFHATNF
jgi:hypothetical protein